MLPVLPSGSDQIFLNQRILGELTGTRVSSFFLTFVDAIYFHRPVVLCKCGYLVTFYENKNPVLRKLVLKWYFLGFSAGFVD